MAPALTTPRSLVRNEWRSPLTLWSHNTQRIFFLFFKFYFKHFENSQNIHILSTPVCSWVQGDGGVLEFIPAVIEPSGVTPWTGRQPFPFDSKFLTLFLKCQLYSQNFNFILCIWLIHYYIYTEIYLDFILKVLCLFLEAGTLELLQQSSSVWLTDDLACWSLQSCVGSVGRASCSSSSGTSESTLKQPYTFAKSSKTKGLVPAW